MVDLGSGERYLGAWQETAARITARDNAVTVFMTLAAALAGASLSSDKIALAGILVGYATLPMVLFSRHHDLIIGHLNIYQLTVSLKSDPHEDCPEWFRNKYFETAMEDRKIRDWALGILMVGCGFIGLLSARRSPDWPHLPIKILWWVSLVCCVTSVGLVWYTGKERRKISERMRDLENAPPGSA